MGDGLAVKPSPGGSRDTAETSLTTRTPDPQIELVALNNHHRRHQHYQQHPHHHHDSQMTLPNPKLPMVLMCELVSGEVG